MAGGLSLLLAFFAFQILPVNAAVVDGRVVFRTTDDSMLRAIRNTLAWIVIVPLVSRTATVNRTAAAPTTTVDLVIGGMTCASCAMRIEKRLNKLGGVTATVNYATEKATVDYDATAVEPEQLVTAVNPQREPPGTVRKIL